MLRQKSGFIRTIYQQLPPASTGFFLGLFDPEDEPSLTRRPNPDDSTLYSHRSGNRSKIQYSSTRIYIHKIAVIN
jgi:hypothetical protein